MVQLTQLFLKTNWNLQCATKEEDCCLKLLSCTVTMLATVETIQNLKFEVLPHPSYSPDLIPCDFHAFGPVREALHCHWFGNDEKVKEVMCTWIREQPKTFFSDGIWKLVDCYKSSVEVPGDKLKNNVTVMYMSLSLWLVKGYCCYFLIDLYILFC